MHNFLLFYFLIRSCNCSFYGVKLGFKGDLSPYSRWHTYIHRIQQYQNELFTICCIPREAEHILTQVQEDKREAPPTKEM